MKKISPPWTRRQFVQRGVTVAGMAAIPSGLARPWARLIITDRDRARAASRALLVDASTVRDLALRAIDTAKSAGASYAEARLTRVVEEELGMDPHASDGEVYGVGVRVLANGAWGFASSPYWNPDEVVQLAREAVTQAKINGRVNPQAVELAPRPVAQGSWRTPIRIDPFTISLDDKVDYMRALETLVPHHVPNRTIYMSNGPIYFYRAERAVAASDGTYFTQTLYRSGVPMGGLTAVVKETKMGVETGRVGMASATGLDVAGAGWELFLDAKLHEQIPHMLDAAEAQLFTPPEVKKPLEVGRYDVVCDASVMMALLHGTLGAATQFDRAVGYEANAGGTSYLGPHPLDLLGHTTLGSTLLNVTADRSMDKGLATVQWDDEGVEPDTFSLVEKGELVDYQTSREFAPALAPWYQRRGRPVRSHGCATAETALFAPVVQTPNLTLVPGTSNATFDDLVANTKKGVALTDIIRLNMDFQSRNGALACKKVEIVNGKLGATLEGGYLMFDASTVWKGLYALGGASSQVIGMGGSGKGQPPQSAPSSIAVVPGSLHGMILVRNS